MFLFTRKLNNTKLPKSTSFIADNSKWVDKYNISAAQYVANLIYATILNIIVISNT